MERLRVQEMNQFTKEELKELMYGLWCDAKHTGKIRNKNLYDKLKSMIDNYCDHKEFYNDGCLSATCVKCGYMCRDVDIDNKLLV
jgi:hypothetical protein